MAEYQFKGDVVEGEAGEEFIIEYLTTNWNGTLLEQKRDYTWDFKIDFVNAGIKTEYDRGDKDMYLVCVGWAQVYDSSRVS